MPERSGLVQRSLGKRYSVALLSVAAALFLRWCLEHWLPNKFGFLTIFGAIAFSVWYGRWKPAVLAAIVGYVSVNFLFFPRDNFPAVDMLAELAGYLFSCVVIIGFGESMHRARDRAEAESTRCRQAQEAEARQAELLSITLTSIGDGVISTDANGAVTFLNPEAERLSGWTSAEARGKPLPEVFRIVHEKTRATVENPVEKVLRTGRVVGLANHTILIAKSGVETPIDDSAAPIRHTDGSLIGVILVFRDFSEQKQAQEVNAHLAAIVEQSGDAIFTQDLNGMVRSWNTSAERLFGYTAAQIVGKPITKLFPHDRIDDEDAILARLRQGKSVESFETVRVAKDGRHITVSVSISPMRDADGEIIGASKIVHEITELVAAREDLKREKDLLATTHSRLDSLVTYAPIIIAMCDLESRFVSVNERTAEVNGLPKEKHFGKKVSEVLPGFGKTMEGFMAKVRDTGEPVTRVELMGETPAAPGEKRHWIASFYPVQHPGGKLLGIGIVALEVTEQKHAQEALKLAHEQLASRALHLENLVQLRTARLNEMVGDLEAFSYSIVHDMRAPLRAMNSFTQLLHEECGHVSPTAENYMKRIRTATIRMDKLIQDGLNYSRLMRAELPLVPMDAAALVRGIIETYPSLQPPHAKIELTGEFPPLKANEATLTQCVSNLLGNAVKFVAPGTEPNVRVWAETRGDNVRLNFKDNGIGIPITAHERIFHIFQRLDNTYEGTGIGLAIVKKAAERMGGSVGLESEPGKGSNFWLELPRADSGPTDSTGK